jgi:protocatechuate 3,4-dioxygenase beta subunit
MRAPCIRAAITVCLFLATNGFAQVINATLNGTVSDSSGALVPGVEVTAKQTETGVVSTTLSNESGAYRFGSLQPGSYQVSAALPDFRRRPFG